LLMKKSTLGRNATLGHFFRTRRYSGISSIWFYKNALNLKVIFRIYSEFISGAISCYPLQSLLSCQGSKPDRIIKIHSIRGWSRNGSKYQDLHLISNFNLLNLHQNKLRWAISELQNNLVSKPATLYGYDGKCKMFMVIVINCLTVLALQLRIVL
jgi:hypothetical protein